MSDPAAGFDPRELPTRAMRGGTADYMDVKWRLVWLRREHPDATISTAQLGHEMGKWATFRAEVSVPGGGSASGHGSETATDFNDYYEKAETKALGRALAALGYGAQFLPDDGEALADSPVDRTPQQRPNAPQNPRPNPPQSANEPVPINANLNAIHAAAAGKVEGDPHAAAHRLAQDAFGVPSMKDLTRQQGDLMRKALGECSGPPDGTALLALAARLNAATSTTELNAIADDVRAASLGPDRKALVSAAFVRVRRSVTEIEAMEAQGQLLGATGTAGFDRHTR